MTDMKAIGLLVIGIGLGLSAGYLLWFRGEVATSLPGRMSSPESAPFLLEQSAPIPGSARPVASREYLESLSETIQGQDPLPRVLGTGEIRGEVHFESGEPAPGATIRLSVPTPRSAGSKPRRVGDPLPSTDLASRVRERIQEEQERMAREWEGTTDAAGQFAATQLSGDRFVCGAYLANHEIVPRVGAWPTSIAIGTKLDLVAKPVVKLTVAVEMESGEPIAMAAITCMQGDRRTLEKWTPSDSVLRLLPGDYVLTASVDDPHWVKSEPLNVQLRAGVETQPIRLILKSRTGVRGRVVFPEGFGVDPEAGYFLLYRQLGSDEAVTTADFTHNDTYEMIFPRRSAAFVLVNLSPGRWVLALGETTDAILAAEELMIAPGRMTEHDLRVPQSLVASALRVDVRGPGGEKAVDARLELHSSGGGGKSNYIPVQQRDPDGRFLVLRRPGVESSAATTWWLKAISPRYGEVLHPLPPPEQSELTLNIAESGSLNVQLTGTKVLENYRHFRVEAEEVPPPGSGPAAARLPGDPGRSFDERGSTAIPALQPGDYAVRVYWQSKVWNRGLLVERRVTITPGKNELAIPIPELYELVVDFESASVAGLCELIFLSPGGEGREFIQSQPWKGKESVRFEGLAAGNYAVRIDTGTQASVMCVEVPTKGPVAFRPIRPTRLRVVESRRSEVLEKLGIRPGDSIVALAGRPISEIAAPDRAVSTLASAESNFVITPERGARRFDLSVDSVQFRSATENGRFLLLAP